MSDYFDRFERQMVRRVEAGAPRRSWFGLRRDILAPVMSLIVVIAIAAVFLSVRGGRSPGSNTRGGIELVYQAEPTAQTPVLTTSALTRAIEAMRRRAEALGIAGASFQIASGDQIRVRLPGVRSLAEAAQVGTSARLEFYDWEANLILPNDRTVASLGPAITMDPTAETLSQGTSGAAPGSPGAGSMPLYQAVQLASKQPAKTSADNARVGPQYWMFGASGSTACTIAGRAYGYTPVPGDRCLLSGPDTSLASLYSGLPNGITKSQGQVLTVPQGTVVIQATPSNFSKPPRVSNPSTQFFVLKDNVALFGQDISNPQEGTDPSGSPDVNFGFTSKGKSEFQTVTGQIARRGLLISPTVGNTQPLDQHFAVALDQQLITVPSIDYRQYPDGIPGDKGGDITGSFTRTSAADLARELQAAGQTINLKLISENQLPLHR